MKSKWILAAGLAAAGGLTGCQSLPPGAEPGPHGTMAFDVSVEASEPGARIEANGESIGNTPLHLKIFGDPDGTFHDFGTDYYVLRAFPLATNQFAQTRLFRTGRNFNGEDQIPKRIYIDMSQIPPASPPGGGPVYVYPGYYGPPAYYYGPPYYYGSPYYYGPGVRFYYGPPAHYRRY